MSSFLSVVTSASQSIYFTNMVIMRTDLSISLIIPHLPAMVANFGRMERISDSRPANSRAFAASATALGTYLHRTERERECVCVNVSAYTVYTVCVCACIVLLHLHSLVLVEINRMGIQPSIWM